MPTKKLNGRLKFSVIRLAVSVLLCLPAGVAGSLFTAPAISGWYQFLNRPPLLLQIGFLLRFGQLFIS